VMERFHCNQNCGLPNNHLPARSGGFCSGIAGRGRRNVGLGYTLQDIGIAAWRTPFERARSSQHRHDLTF
jgi:hypothetical protein